MVDVSDHKKLQAWLKTQPKQVSVLIAARLAARMLPLIGESPTFGSGWPEQYFTLVVLPVFRANATSRLIGTWPNINAPDLARRAERALLHVDDAYLPAPDLYRKVPNQDDAFKAALYAVVAATQSFVYAEIAGAAVDTVYDSAASDAVWKAVQADVDLLLHGLESARIGERDIIAFLRVAKRPIWHGTNMPEQIVAPWHRLRTGLLTVNDSWDVWIDFYERQLRGDDASAEWLSSFVAWPEEDWKQGPAHINRLIKERLAALSPINMTAEISEKPDQASIEFLAAPPIRPPPKIDYFISYATPDEPFAREVADVVYRLGKTSIVQFRDFGPGSNFVERMNRGLEAERVIALYSPAYNASDFCQAEWNAAYASDPLGTKRRLVPLLLQPSPADPLARLVQFWSLVGLDKDSRRAKIIEALTYWPKVRSYAVLRDELAAKASPDVQVVGGRLDATANPIFDKPVSSFDLADLPAMQRAVIQNLRGSLPPNTPRVIRSSLEVYFEQLERGPSRIIVGILVQQASPIFKEAQSAEAGLWSDGVTDVLQSFQQNHDTLITHYPLKEDRERIFSETPVDEDKASGKALTEPATEVAKAAAAVEQAGLATPEYAKTAAQMAQTAKDVDLPPPAEPPREDVVTPKRRHILTSIGFYERAYNLIGSTATLMATAPGLALYDALGRAIEALLRFVRQG